MDKVKLAICMQDLEYQERFVNCLMNHYEHQYEVHVFTSLNELKVINPLTYSVIITGEYSIEEMTNFVEEGEKLLFLTEDVCKDETTMSENIFYTSKYQEVYKITELIQRITASNSTSQSSIRREGRCKRTGLYSLSKEKYQIPVAVLLAEILGESERVLLLDLQAHSGLMEKDSNFSHMGLEDLLSVATTGNYSKGRLLECIGHGSNWDYIYPAKNTQCLAEGSLELYERMLEILVKELGYQRVLINFGSVFSGHQEMMERCEDFYLLSGKEAMGEWREGAFLDELHRKDKTTLLHKMRRIEVPEVTITDGTWSFLLEKWRWSSLGESLRQMMNEERDYGASM